MIFRLSILLLLCLGTVARPSLAHDDPDTPPPPDESTSSTTESENDSDDPPSLDELLGIDDETPDEDAADPDDRRHEDNLKRRLSEREINQSFTLVLDNMTLAADRLENDLDPGLTTQRLQQAVLDQLDALVKDAQRSRPQPSRSGTQQPDDQSTDQSPGRRNQQTQDQTDGSRNPKPADASDAPPPEFQPADPNAPIEETGEEWGALPDRIREMLQQGRSEKFSSLYERLTREYYRRLAEQSSS